MTANSLFATDDYAAAIQALFPRGRVWPNDPTAVQPQVFAAAWAPTPQRLDVSAQQLLIDSFPGTTVALLPDWEESLGLTETDAALSNAARQANIVAKLVEVGGQSRADFIAYAATLGATITIETYAPFRCGYNGCGDEIGGEDWCFAWSITVTANTGALTDAQILAAIQAIAPAETDVFLA